MLNTLKIKLSTLFSYRATLILSFIVLLPPFIVEQAKIGIDQSWKIGLGYATLNGFVFGRDVLFTYGPLHFLIAKAGILYNFKWIIVLFELTTISFLLYIFLKVYQRESHPLKGIFLLLFCFLLSNFSCDYYVMLIFLYSVYQVLIESKTKYLYILFYISIITFFIKINFGFINFMVMLLASVSHAVTNHKKIPKILSLIISFPLLILILSSVLNVEIQKYLLDGVKIIDGYNDAMMLPFSISDFVDWIGLLVLVVFAFMILSNLKFFIQRSHLLLSFIFFLYYFLLFKMGFVRADGHVYIFIFNSVMFYFLFYVWDSRMNYIRQCFVATLILGFISIPMGVLNYAVLKKDSWFNPMEKLDLWTYGIDFFSDISYKRSFDDKTVDPIKVSESQLKIISDKTVDILPEDISIIYRHDLNYNPRPVIQSYSAYSLFLDSLNYKKYTSLTSPDFLLFLNRSIDHRVAFWDESITKRAILDNYELIETEDRYDKAFLLFGKSSKPKKDSVQLISSFSSEIAATIDIPEDTDNVYLYLEVQYSLWGKLKRLLFQAPILEIEFVYSDDTKEIYRCIPSIANTGVLINKSVKTNQDAYNFFKENHQKLKKIIQFKLLPKSGFDSMVKGRFVKIERKS